MLSKLRVQHYKSLFDTEVDLEPLTVFIGPNGSGKSNICETLSVLSDFIQRLIASTNAFDVVPFFLESLTNVNKNQQIIESKFWQGKRDYLYFEASTISKINNEDIVSNISVRLDYPERIVAINTSKNSPSLKSQYTGNIRDFLVSHKYSDSLLGKALQKVSVYDFAPTSLSNNIPSTRGMDKTGQGIVDALADILLSNRKNFDELEERLTRLVPNIQRISCLSFITISTLQPKAFKNRNSLSIEKLDNLPFIKAEIFGWSTPKTSAASA